MGRTVLLSGTDVRRLMPISTCIELVREAFLATALGKAEQPIRTGLQSPSGGGILSFMPGAVSEPLCFGIKVVSVFPTNDHALRGAHQGVVLIFDECDGALRGAIDARMLTAMRTAAASAVATDLLARRGRGLTMSILGYGDQALHHARTLPVVRNIRKIVIWGRSAERGEQFVDTLRAELDAEIEFTAALSDAMAADIICTTTAAREPFVHASMLSPGIHLNAVGSSTPQFAELSADIVAHSRFFVDYLPSALELAAELRQALAEQLITQDELPGSIGDVMQGRCVGRESDEDVTVFKSLGMSAEDLVCGRFLIDAAEREGTGTWFGF